MLGYTLKEIAALVNGHLLGEAQVLINGVNSLDKASKEDISFFADPRYKAMLKDSRAGALLVAEENGQFAGPQILVPNPVVAFARVAALFISPPTSRAPGVSEQAIIHESSRIGNGACIHPLAYVGEEVVIGDGVVLFPGVYIGDRVRVGARTIIYPNVTVLKDCLIGRDVIIHAGTVIGSDGFGYVPVGEIHMKIPQLGIVQIDDNVEIGANNTIDRAALGKTWIQSGVKTDNLVHIAHNVIIGQNTIVVAQTAIGGSTHIGRQVVIGGHVAIADHLEIGDRAMIGSKSGVAKSIPSGDIVSGTTTMPHRLWLRTRTLIPRLPEFRDRIKDLEKRLQELEQRLRE